MPEVDVPLGSNSGTMYVPVGMVMDNVRWCTDGVPATADSAPMLVPSALSEITHFVLRRGGKGTNLRAQFVYPAAATITTDLKIQVFGKSSPNGEWDALKNRNGDFFATLAASINDPVNNAITHKTTIFNDLLTLWDCGSHDWFKFAVNTAAVGSVSLATSYVVAKFM